MNNTEIIKNWKSLKIKFKSQKKSVSLASMFLLCVGESEIDVQGNKESVVGFYQGFDQKGSPAALFSSDENNICYTYGKNQDTHIKAVIGRFIKSK